MATIIAITAITTNNSVNVNPLIPHMTILMGKRFPRKPES
jgi:hypothetical protein